VPYQLLVEVMFGLMLRDFLELTILSCCRIMSKCKVFKIVSF